MKLPTNQFTGWMEDGWLFLQSLFEFDACLLLPMTRKASCLITETLAERPASLTLHPLVSDSDILMLAPWEVDSTPCNRYRCCAPHIVMRKMKLVGSRSSPLIPCLACFLNFISLASRYFLFTILLAPWHCMYRSLLARIIVAAMLGQSSRGLQFRF